MPWLHTYAYNEYIANARPAVLSVYWVLVHQVTPPLQPGARIPPLNMHIRVRMTVHKSLY